MKLFMFCCVLCCWSSITFSQVKGLVQGKDSFTLKPLTGAKVKLLQANTGVYTNEEGTFELVLPKLLPDTIVISAIGYYNDTVIVTKKDRFISLHIVLFAKSMMKEVVLESRKRSSSISRMKTLHVEELTAAELRKAACCNLSESFETNASVDVNITDAVSGAKKIQMMGLDGVYTQLQLENIPFLRGLESSFGLHSMPGTWIESIQITKGTGNVVNGYESMAGLVNLELKKPQEMERFYFNVYQNSQGRSELNLNAGHQLSKKWTTGWFAHASSVYGNIDHNHDKFRDLPMGDNIAFFNRWDFRGKKMEAQFGVNLNQDRKVGGQTTYFRDEPAILPSPPLTYGVLINSKHADAFAKTGFFGKKPSQSLGIVYHAKYHLLDGVFGIRPFSGEEKRGFINVIYDDYIATTDHKIKSGLSFLYLDITQSADSISTRREEIVPGAFVEYTLTTSRWSVVSGIRYDFHNLFKHQISPRLHAKYTLDEFTDLRFTAGRGWRVPNYMIDNISLLASSKTWTSPNQLLPEISWNFGGSVVKDFKLFQNKANIAFDIYHTRFSNQLVIDRDTLNSNIVFKNLENSSYSNSIQLELCLIPMRNFDIRLAYKFLDVKALYGGQMQQQVMIPRHRGFTNLAYRTRNKRWEYDLTLSVFGQSRLPDVSENDSPRLSNIYPVINGQVTHIYKKWDFYIGGENLGNYKQPQPIIEASNPFNPNFDATEIWGPVMGIVIYGGIRYQLKKVKKK
ncbi:MAG: TonB-dependent receptor [Bacteroidetes bacterium]|nr:TonB-dependent receptor [Bacteroidota bacterium]